MIKIDYNESVVKCIGDFGFETSVIVGDFDSEKFKITLSSSPMRQNNEPRRIEGSLSSSQMTEVLREFDYIKSRREYIDM